VINVNQLQLNVSLAHLHHQMGRFVTELGMGVKTVVRDQSALLQKDLMVSLPPSNKSGLEKRIARDVRKVIIPRFGDWKIKKMGLANGQRKSKMGNDIVWLEAGPKWLTGVNKGWFRENETPASLKQIFDHNRGKMGKMRINIGYRGKQRVHLIKRFVVKKGVFNKFVKAQTELVGKLKASFVLAWFWGVAAPKGGNIPKWIARHIENRTVKGSFISTLNDKDRPTMTIISEASGVTRQHSRNVINAAMRRRARMIPGHIRNLLRLRDAGKWTPPQE